MKPHEQTVLNKIGKVLAKPLSHVVANSMTESPARLAEAYWCILHGKGAGTGWCIDAEINAARSLIRTQSPVVFDVGANVGDWASLIHQAYPEASLFIFEPQPKCQERIRERNIPKSILIPKAVSAAGDQTVKLFTPGSTDGLASLHQRRDSYFRDNSFASVDVQTITIDETMEIYGLRNLDFMKIDVEGHELSVLEGAKKSLEENVIKALSFEFGSGNINSRTFFHDFWDFLTPLGYQIYRILPSSRLMPIREYYEDCEYFRGVTNYVAALPLSA